MDEILSLIQQHRAPAAAFMSALSLTTAGFLGLWIFEGLRDGVTWMGSRWKPRRDETPLLFELAIAAQAIMLAAFAIFGTVMFVWSLLLAG
ncbi:MAG TPA: hypothetical protein VMU59_10990 [Caulobacteraceae bacterium]|nr:hypothetical protein [Caulobacteraceae bacterium]